MADRYVMVPVEATEEMLGAGYNVTDLVMPEEHRGRRTWTEAYNDEMAAIYRHMIASRPPVGEEVVEEWADAMMSCTPQPLTRVIAKSYARAILNHPNTEGE